MDTHPNPPRWVPDPTGRHQYRYWDGAQWTDHVSDHGVTSTESVTATGPVAPVGGVPPAYEPSYQPSYQYVTQGWVTDPTKVMGRRYGAFFIDGLLVVAVVALLFFSFATRYTVAQALTDPACHYASDSSNQVSCDNRFVITTNNTVYELRSDGSGYFIGFLLAFDGLYFAVLQGLIGATLGKLATGVRVVQADGSPPGVLRAAVRSLLFLVDGPFTIYICGVVTTATSRGHRRVGDMAAGTYVVAKERAGEPVVV